MHMNMNNPPNGHPRAARDRPPCSGVMLNVTVQLRIDRAAFCSTRLRASPAQTYIERQKAVYVLFLAIYVLCKYSYLKM